MGCCINGKSNNFFNSNFFLIENVVIKSHKQIINDDNHVVENKPKGNNNENIKKKEKKENNKDNKDNKKNLKSNDNNKNNKINDSKNNNDIQKNSVCSSELSDSSINK